MKNDDGDGADFDFLQKLEPVLSSSVENCDLCVRSKKLFIGKKLLKYSIPKIKVKVIRCHKLFFIMNIGVIETQVYADEKESRLIFTSLKLNVRGFSRDLQLQTLKVTFSIL